MTERMLHAPMWILMLETQYIWLIFIITFGLNIVPRAWQAYIIGPCELNIGSSLAWQAYIIGPCRLNRDFNTGKVSFYNFSWHM